MMLQMLVWMERKLYLTLVVQLRYLMKLVEELVEEVIVHP